MWTLAHRLGGDTEKTASDYVAVCRSLSKSLGFAPPKEDTLGKLSPMLVVAHLDSEREPEEPSFKLRDEVLDAIALVEERT
ncbi:hypothetical protein [Nitratireductor sp. GCM10026969]|uniref:hypothetical protein n=1 Tax=Nitratireductor sp. GCM10026969 TaxID=3252645 RepID=UPI00361B2B89